ncbi:vascular endothelial growth factor A-like [Lampetra fluviatilis]
MRSLPTASATAWLLLLLHLLHLLLHLVTCQALSVLNGPYMTSSEVVRFEEVMQRSYCRPMETMVPVSREFPDEVAHFFRPACVPLLRCSGCCNDEGSECVPTHTTTITIQVYKNRPSHGGGFQELPFTQHSECECRERSEQFKPQTGLVCRPCSERRRHLFVQDAASCACSCKFSRERCRQRGQELNLHTCRCERPRR